MEGKTSHPIEIALTENELKAGALAGYNRNIEAIAKSRKHSHGYQPQAFAEWGRHCEGALAEIAVAKYLGLAWDPQPYQGKMPADVGQAIEVRWSSFGDPKKLCLVIRNNDKDRPFVLVTGDRGNYTLWGYCYRWAITDHTEWITDLGNGRQPSWFVPVDRLIPLSYLKELASAPESQGSAK